MTGLKNILSYTYKKRAALNPRYSKNAFARDLRVSPTALSQFMSGKRNFSKTNIERISKALALPPGSISKMNEALPSAHQIEIETFSLIADWYHFAILNLVEVDKVKDTEQMAKRLGIPKDVAASAEQRLIDLGFLKKTRGGFKRIQNRLDAGYGIPSEALRKHNREKMELAIESLEKVPLNERDISSLTLPLDPSKISGVKREIQKFKEKINKICAKNTGREVYSLNIQLFPLSKKELVK